MAQPERHPDNDPAYAGHAFAATKHQATAEDRLRDFGYRIHSRPPAAEPIWVDASGKLWTQTEALASVRKTVREIEAARPR